MNGERAKSRRDLFDRDAVVAVSRETGHLLRAASEARARCGLAAEDLLIYLAVGHLGIDASGEIPRMIPCSLLQIAEFLNVPRETVRRKVGRLCDRGYTRSGPTGVVVGDVQVWLRQASALFVRSPAAGDGRDDRDAAQGSDADVAELRHRGK